MKTIFNTETVMDFASRNEPSTIKVQSTKLIFSKQAGKLLALKHGSKFILEHEGGKLFFVETTKENGLLVSETGKHKFLQCMNHQLIKFMLSTDPNIKIGTSFLICEIKDGRRLLTPVLK